jgi:tRNA 2-thiouridine synthesizing protein C
MPVKRVLLVFGHPAHDGGAARDGLDAGLAALAFDQPLALLFEGAGVTLLRPRPAAADGLPDWLRGLRTLPLHGAGSIGADAAALAAHGLEPASLLLPAQPLDAATRARWIAEADVVLAF